MANRHDSDYAGLAVDAVDDPEAADTILPQPFEFAEQWLAAFGIG